METISFERAGTVGWVRLDRPEKLNAMTGQMWAELRELGTQLVNDGSLRCVVVIGNGRAFSAGIDTSQFGGDAFSALGPGDGGDPAAASSDGGQDPLVEVILRAQEAYTWLEDAPYPTVAAVRGYALGAGLQLALACDLRVVARGTRLGMLEHRYGLLPDLGGTSWLPKLVGPGKAKELTFTAAQIDAEEAHRIGLVERLVDDERLEDEVAELAAHLAAQPPVAVRGAKRAINAAAGASRAESLRLAAEGQAACIRSADFAEAVAAFLEGRPPAFEGR